SGHTASSRACFVTSWSRCSTRHRNTAKALGVSAICWSLHHRHSFARSRCSAEMLAATFRTTLSLSMSSLPGHHLPDEITTERPPKAHDDYTPQMLESWRAEGSPRPDSPTGKAY